MASITLGILGNALIPGVGGVVGAVIGSIVDQQLLFPLLAKGQGDVSAPSLPALRAPSYDEGWPKFFCLGKGVRVPCNIIALGPLTKEVAEYDNGVAVRHDLFIDLAAELCVAPGTPIEDVPGIYANGEKVFQSSDTITLNGSDIDVIHIWDNSENSWRKFFRAPIAVDGTKLTEIRQGYDFTVTGFTGAGNTGTFRAFNVYQDASYEVIFCGWGFVVANDEGPGFNVTIEQTGVPNEVAGKVESLTVYTGTDVQVADPVLEAALGAGNVPGYRGRAYLVCERLKVTKYGGGVPRIEAIVVEDSDRMLAETLVYLSTVNGFLIEDDIDVSLVTDQEIDGILWKSDEAPLTIIKRLLLIYDLVQFEFAGKVWYASRAVLNDDRITIDPELLAAADSEAGTAARPAEVAEPDNLGVPRSITVQFQDATRVYQEGSRTVRRLTGETEVNQRITLPVSLDPADAEILAKKILWGRVAAETGVRFTLPPSMIGMRPSDLVFLAVPEDDERFNYRVEQVEEGANHLLELTAVQEDPSTFDQTGEGGGGGFDDDVDYPITVATLLDVPAFLEAEYQNGFHLIHFAISAPGATVPVSGSVFRRESGETSWTSVGEFSNFSTVGVTTNVLGDAESAYPDEASTLTVVMDNGTPVSVSTEAWRAGENRYLIGDEIIDVRTATLVSDRTYTLSGLRRGRLNTEQHTGSHVAGDRVVLIGASGAGLIREPMGATFPLLEYTCVTNGYDIDEMDVRSAQLTGQSRLAYSVWKLEAVTDPATGNITVSWLHRVPFYPMFSGLRSEANMRWNVLIYKRTLLGDELVRQATNLVDESYPFQAFYTKAQQTADGIVAGNTIVIDIRQVGTDSRAGRAPTDELTVVAI
ncbi:MAG: phage tail protein [Planctomycetota bacterium]